MPIDDSPIKRMFSDGAVTLASDDDEAEAQQLAAELPEARAIERSGRECEGRVLTFELLSEGH